MRRTARMAVTWGGFVGCLILFAAGAGASTPLEQAVEQGKVKVTIQGLGGSTGDTIQIDIQRKQPEALVLTLTSGTVFMSRASGTQNMVGISIQGELVGADSYRPGHEIVLHDDASHDYVIEAYCLDFHKDNPGFGDAFTLSPPDERARAICETGRRMGASIGAIQAALWMDRDGVSDPQIQQRFPVTDADLQTAHRILKEVGPKAAGERSGA